MKRKNMYPYKEEEEERHLLHLSLLTNEQQEGRHSVSIGRIESLSSTRMNLVGIDTQRMSAPRLLTVKAGCVCSP